MSTQSDVRSQVEHGNQQFMAAFKAGDAASLSRLYTREAQLLPANSDVVRGTDAIRAFWQGALDMGLREATLETVEVDALGDTAIEVGRYRLLADEGVQADHGKYIVIWKKDADRWKLHRDIWTTSQPPAA
jgi:uncharacterized protein (TIGR02246 family)